MTEAEKRAAIHKAAESFVNTLHAIGGTDASGDRLASAELTIALRHIEDAEFRAMRHIKLEHKS